MSYPTPPDDMCSSSITKLPVLASFGCVFATSIRLSPSFSKSLHSTISTGVRSLDKIIQIVPV